MIQRIQSIIADGGARVLIYSGLCIGLFFIYLQVSLYI